MIRTEKEYRAALSNLKEEEALAAQQRTELTEEGFSSEEVERGMQPLLSFSAQLREEIAWYESACRGQIEQITQFEQIGRSLIALRIASAVSQKELAARLGVSEAQVSRDEHNEYHGITIERFQRIARALNGTVTTRVSLDANARAIPGQVVCAERASEQKQPAVERITDEGSKLELVHA